MFQTVYQCTLKCVNNRSFTKWTVLCGNFNKLNPGIRKRMNMMESEGSGIDDTEDLDDSESDFMGGNKMYDQHKRELRETKEMEQLKMVGQKYFKGDKAPNMLTWAEKEQLKYLHNRDPQEWTIEKLSQSFPVSQLAVKKILKGNWKPEDMDRILKHDETVKSNWKLFRDGKLEVDADLKKHLSQFTKRKHILPRPDLSKFADTMNSKPVIQTKSSEFSDIIESYNSQLGRENPNKQIEMNTSNAKQIVCIHTLKDDNVKAPPPDEDFFHLGGKMVNKKGKPMTLDSYQEQVRHSTRKDGGSEIDKFLVRSGGNDEHLERKDSSFSLKERHDKMTTLSVPALVTDLTFKDRQKNMTTVPNPTPMYVESINIPRHKWKEGCTYKVHDCYYDDDGEFLYRVPGMKD